VPKGIAFGQERLLVRNVVSFIGISVVLGIVTASPAHAPSPELDSCHDDLDQVRKAASDASEAAEEAKSKFEEFDDCKRDPDVYDLLHDGCRSHRDDYESAQSDLESKMDDLDGRLRSVQDSCGYDFTINRMSALEASQHRLEVSQRRFCGSIRKFVTLGVSPNQALQICKANGDEQFCKACLGMK
jgi:hypothetical protein